MAQEQKSLKYMNIEITSVVDLRCNQEPIYGVITLTVLSDKIS